MQMRAKIDMDKSKCVQKENGDKSTTQTLYIMTIFWLWRTFGALSWAKFLLLLPPIGSHLSSSKLMKPTTFPVEERAMELL